MQSLSISEEHPASADPGSIVELDQLGPAVDAVESQVKGISDELAAEGKKLEQLESTLHQLEPVEEVDIDISALRDPRYVFSMLGVIPAANTDRLKTSLARVPHVFLTLRQDPGKQVVWLAGNKANSDVLERAAHSAYLNPLVLPEDYQGTPGNIIQNLRDSIAETGKKMTELKDQLARIGETQGPQLRELLGQAHTSRVLADAIVRFGQLRHTYVITGWVPAEKLDGLIQRLRQASKEMLIEALPTKRFGDNLHVPVALSNNPLLRPFQMLVTTYSRPRYGELDPTYLVAITFPILFGAMFGDIGQGLVLALMGWLISSGRIPKLKSMAGLGALIMICGISATVFGFLYGSVFMFEENFLGIELHPLWINPLHDIMSILIVAVAAGVVLLLLSYILSIVNGVLSRDWGHVLFGHTGVSAFLLYVSLLGIGATFIPNLNFPIPRIVFIVLAAISAVAVMISEVLINLVEGHRPLVEGGLGTYFIQAPIELFEVFLTLVSNTLSFVRVGAFAVAHGGLSSVFFILADLAGGGSHNLLYWLIVIIGNIFIVGFEGLIVGIQTMRLHYYEILGKFFTGGGARFEPLTLQPTKSD